jgi:hypothetical protein
MFKIQHKDFPNAEWRDVNLFGRNAFPTEEEAWKRVASFDQDGIIDKVTYRVVPRT